MNLSKYKTHNGYLLVKELSNSGDDKKSGIYLPVEKDEEAQTSRCEVVLSFEGSKCKVGDIVFFSKLMPDDVFLINDEGEEEELWFILESDIKMSEHD